MRNILLATFAASALMVPAAFADDAPAVSEDHSCAMKSQIDRFSDGDEPDTIIVTIGSSQKYRVTLNGCPNLKFAGIGARIEGSGGMCLGPGDRIVFHERGINDSCMITKVEKLPPKKPANGN